MFFHLVKFRQPCHANKSNSTLNSSLLVRLCMPNVVDNIMTCVFERTVLNCNYLGGYCMNFFKTWVCFTNLCFLSFQYSTLGGHVKKRMIILL